MAEDRSAATTSLEREQLLDDLAYWRGVLSAHRDVNHEVHAASIQVLTKEGYNALLGVLDRATKELRSDG